MCKLETTVPDTAKNKCPSDMPVETKLWTWLLGGIALKSVCYFDAVFLASKKLRAEISLRTD
eukprot:1219550-Ditylum_brightwellii.AAC.1